jgi:transcriptional regulator with XRE-family HTH domain
MASALGMKINELRRKKGLTLEDLAKATDSSKSYMWEIENKDVARPSAEKLDRIATALDVTADFLIDATSAEQTDDQQDRAFFRKFQQATPETKATLKKILGALDEDD